MRTLKFSDPDFKKEMARLDRRYIPEARVKTVVEEILAAVEKQGDKALLNYTAQFDGIKLTRGKMLVDHDEVAAAEAAIDGETRQAVVAAIDNVRRFARRSMRQDWISRNSQGALVGERFHPFDRVGIYVPGGTAPLASSAVMTASLASTAGVPQIVVTTPCDKQGKVAPALLYALHLAGATEIYRVGGAQAIAAMAYGTATIRPVVKIFGPGNVYVVEAKRQVFGRVAIDLLPGPSEIMILADETADPAWVASDLLAQAEHGHGSAICMITNSARLINATRKQLVKQAGKLKRQQHLSEVLEKHTYLIRVRDLVEGITIANAFAPEHLLIIAREEDQLAAQVRTAGAIFLGGYSPVAAGDFVAGPSHELPTGGAGKSFSGLTVDQFQRRTSIVRFDKSSLQKSLSTIQKFSAIEGLDAHGRSATIRYE